MKPVESSIVIGRPIEACFAYLGRRQLEGDFPRLKQLMEPDAS